MIQLCTMLTRTLTVWTYYKGKVGLLQSRAWLTTCLRSMELSEA